MSMPARGTEQTGKTSDDCADFRGVAAVVTGGSSGIGLATARRLVDRGARVAILDRDDGPSDMRAALLRCDLADDTSVRAAVAAAAHQLDGIDVLVNNAAIGARGTIADNPDEEWHRVLDVNVVGTVRVSRAALTYLRASRCAAVVNVCSIAATAGLPQRALYGASKGALLALTLAMAADHVAEGIRVNCVTPGTVDTPWVTRLLEASDHPSAERAALEARQPTGRLVTPDEVAEAIVYLASPASASVTATALPVDGGLNGLRLPARGDGSGHPRRTAGI
jgi:NAD(P)-dependent dehydrogenase (short-subunit alcohol dehydrogenase family)